MRTLIEKEIRMLLPAFVGALVLATLPVWLLPVNVGSPGAIPGFLFWLGAVMLALSSFGREIALKTLPFALAQPLERARIWWTKVAVLGVFLALAFDAWWLSGSLRSILRPALRASREEVLALSVVSVAMYAAGGLLMTLLLRQTAAAFWLTILIPMVMVIPIQAMGGTNLMTFTALGLYAVATFFLARRQFLHLQDTAWTGGVISFGARRAAAEHIVLRERMPWAALFRKELKLHEFTLAGIAGLFVVHLGVVALRKLGADIFGNTTLWTLQMFGAVWLFVPLLAGSQSVAEERQLGTLDALLCVPVSRRVQFGIKLLFVLILGGLISAALLCAAERIASAIGAGANLGVMGITFKGTNLILVFLVFLALSLLGFYASTLTRSVAQALAAGVVATLVFWEIFRIQSVSVGAFGLRLWPVMALPTLTVAIIWLAYGNFRWQFESGRRWRRNILDLTTVIVLISASAAAIYHRVWECATPHERGHGTAKLLTGKPVLLRNYGGGGLGAVLPDGRLWVKPVVYGRRATVSYFAPGSNWVDAVPLAEETVGIRSDGTLWASEKPQSWIVGRHPPAEESPPLVQFGGETNWQSLGRFSDSSVVLLKRDGTLWRWGTNSFNKPYRGLRALTPFRLGTASDWARILQGVPWIYAWERDGSAWALGELYPGKPLSILNEVKLDTTTVAWRVRDLDHVQFRSVNQNLRSTFVQEVGVRDNGTLWYWDWRGSQTQIGRDSNWAAVTGCTDISASISVVGRKSNSAAVTGGFHLLVALKTDGSIWEWKFDPRKGTAPQALEEAPVRLGTHNDWVGVLVAGGWLGETVTLSSDGVLWRWERSDLPLFRWHMGPDQWLTPSRRWPAKIENILAHDKPAEPNGAK